MNNKKAKREKGFKSTGLRSFEYLPLHSSGLICEATHRHYLWWSWSCGKDEFWWELLVKEGEGVEHFSHPIFLANVFLMFFSPHFSRKPLLHSLGHPSRRDPGCPPQSPWYQHCENSGRNNERIRQIRRMMGGLPVCEHVGQAESVVIFLGENFEKLFHVVVSRKPVINHCTVSVQKVGAPTLKWK